MVDTEQKAEKQVIYDLVYLCGCTVNGDMPDAERVAKMDLAALYQTAERHMLAAVAAHALESAGLHDPAFTQAKAMAIRKMVIVDNEMTKVLERLEAAGIWYMPLKGAVLKDMYPAYGIRQMSDRDILIDAERATDVKEIMEKLGFSTERFGEHFHDCYMKLPVSNFEMHRRLSDAKEGKRISGYYAEKKNHLLKDNENAFGRHFSSEDFYLYMVVHEYKHYTNDGTGLRSLLDTYIYLKNVELDYEYVVTEAEKLGIAEFEKANRELAIHLFKGEQLTESERKMLERFAISGTYVKTELYAENLLALKGRRDYFLSRLTLPYPVMQGTYPVLKRFPVLYPLCWAHRLVHALIYKNDKVKQQLRAGLSWKGERKNK